MPTQVQIAKRWGVSKVRVFQLVKQGCPTSSFAAADKWRAERGQQRPPTRGSTKPENLKKKAAAEKEKPMKKPTTSKLNRKMATVEVEKRIEVIRVKLDPPIRTGDSLLDALNESIYQSECASQDYHDARLRDSPSRSIRLVESTRAMRERFMAEKLYREEQERRGNLVDRRMFIAGCRRAIEAMLTRLKRIPIEAGPQCNPADPLMATQVLDRAVSTVMEVGAKSFRESKERSRI